MRFYLNKRCLNLPLSIAAVLVAGACNTGNVQVQDQGAGNSGGGAPGIPGQNLTENQGSANRAGGVSKRIYFETVSTRDGIPDVVTGFAYLASSASQTSDGGMNFETVSNFTSETDYFPTTTDLGYLGSDQALGQTPHHGRLKSRGSRID